MPFSWDRHFLCFRSIFARQIIGKLKHQILKNLIELFEGSLFHSNLKLEYLHVPTSYICVCSYSKISFVCFSGFRGGEKLMTQKNLPPDCTFFNFKIFKSNIHWPNRGPFQFLKSCSRTLHFSMNRSTFIAHPMQLHCCLNCENISMLKSVCFAIKKLECFLRRFSSFQPSYRLSMGRAQVSSRCQLASNSHLSSLPQNLKFFVSE